MLGRSVVEQGDNLAACQAAIGYRFRDADLLRRALVHASSTDDRTVSNERLEFLGDAVLGAVVSEKLFRDYPRALEGELTRIKSTVVSRRTLAKVSRRLGLGRFLVLGKGIALSARLPVSVLAAAFESVVAAVYLDGGLEAARDLVERSLSEEIVQVAENRHHRNFKSLLQNYAQRRFGVTPTYEVLDEQGPEHSKAFCVAAVVGNRRFAPAWGPSKKSAEQAAASAAYRVLTETDPDHHDRHRSDEAAD